MATFQDVKTVFHNIGNWFGLVGNFFQGWPWPLEYMAAPFWYFRDLFYAADWVWDGLDERLQDISNLWNWASSFTSWVSQRLLALESLIPSWSSLSRLIASALGISQLHWDYLRIKINQSIAATLGLPEFTWGWLISKIQSEISGGIDLSWLVTTKLPLIDASIQDIWNRLADLRWENLIYNAIGTFGVSLNTIATWFMTKRPVIDSWFDTTRLALEADVAALKEVAPIEGIKEHLIDWIVEELDKQW